jgi:hypothetical protein
LHKSDLLFPTQFEPKKGATTTDTPPINFSLKQLRYLNVSQTGLRVFTQLNQYYLQPTRAKRPSPFYLDYFSSPKNFISIAKDTSIFHLKWSSNSRSNYFPTSTPSSHTTIAMADLLQAIGC